MDKKNIGIVLIVLGGVDLLMWLFSASGYGWLEYVVGVNIVSEYAAIFMIIGGFALYKKGKALDSAEVDEVLDLDTDEKIVFKQVSADTIVTITNKKIIYRNFGIDENVVNNHADILTDEKSIILFNDIKSVVAVRTKDTATSKLGGVLNLEFGIQIQLKDGMKYNLPTAKSELLCAHISKYL
ncbi:MAG: hypothetical protein CMP56_04895 [Flavobacteriales bacterium]|nr:hypothetical protein [Flavobacteriales bacterium]